MPDLRLLGPVELRGAAGRRYSLGPPQQRCVMAVLAMTPGWLVPVETLIARVWRDEPTSDMRDVVYTYVSRLRRTLRQAEEGSTPAPEIRRDNGGYVLTLDDANVDLHRARNLVRQARQQQTGDPVRASELLGEAAALWRGSPLAGLRGRWAEEMRVGLQRELVTLLTERYDLELRLGRHAQSVVALSAEVVDHPLAEPLTGLLMLALYRSGRQADALQAYSRTRHVLVQTIGEEPGPELRRLHEQVLRRDPALEPGPDFRRRSVDRRERIGEPHPAIRTSVRDGSPDAPVAGGPAQLPSDDAGFIGRRAYAERLDRMGEQAAGPSRDAAVCVITGSAGVGKTALALHWAHRVAGAFPAGQLYVNLRGYAAADSPTEPAEALHGFLQALGVADDRIPQSTDARTALFRSLLAGRRFLVVLDNARDTDQVAPLLPGASGCATVVTSRRQMPYLVATTGADQIVLPPFSPEEARSMLFRLRGDGRTESREQAVAEVVGKGVRLPLALRLVAPHLTAPPGGAPHLSCSAHVADIRTVFTWSYGHLSPAAARLFRLLGLHPGPELSTGAAACLAGLAPRRARPLLSELTRAGLLTEPAPDWFSVHDLLRDYAAELARTHDTAADRQDAVQRALDHYVHSARAVCRTPVPPHPARRSRCLAGRCDP
ncbi:AfsR/SARP family transcriptional regulator [Streptomyces sp. NBC_01808]|uniref:AfsR/SARP family transcriptional regulator n=1 Tax=Streptomyces sp. NBC_01808 TaxID=2975947 RepID=UPI002DDC667E|nr:AfsR/SARP family transcriptional regulator [Streptomyces sp. NBC_01808]WSA36304.1 AfsR/SARP family transcriptional regulator [Streptomyces sp. NBC_01808]